MAHVDPKGHAAGHAAGKAPSASRGRRPFDSTIARLHKLTNGNFTFVPVSEGSIEAHGSSMRLMKTPTSKQMVSEEHEPGHVMYGACWSE